MSQHGFQPRDASSPDGDKLARGFQPRDHEQLTLAQDLMLWASEIVNDLMERHRLDLTMQMVSFLSEAKQDADLGKRAVDMADRYMQWGGASTAQEGETA